MSLSRVRNKERMRKARLVQPKCNLNPIQAKLKTVQPKLEAVGIKLEGNKIVGIEREVVRVPLYNSSVHKAGDRVLVHQGNRLVEVTVPELDGSGNPVPAFS